MKRAIIALSLIMLVFGFSSCRQTMVVPPGILFPQDSEWSITINGIDPSDPTSSKSITCEKRDSYTLLELMADGYEFICYVSTDGTEYPEGTVLTKDDDGLVLTAKWVTAVSVSSSESLADVINNASDDVAIILNDGTYTEASGIQVRNGQFVLLKGAGVESSEVKTNITLAADSSLRLEDMTLSAYAGNLIDSSYGGVEIEIEGSRLIPAGNARGINIAVSDEESRNANTSVVLKDSSIELQAVSGGDGISRGISVNGDASNGNGKLSSLSIKLNNSSIKNSTGNSAYGISLFRILELNIDISDNSAIEIQKNHYPIYIYGCGSEETVSKINITDTSLKGYSAYYMKGNSKNIDASFTDCTFTCINQNTGDSSNFSVLAVYDSTDCHTSADGCNFIIGPEAEGYCEMHIAGTQYSDHSFGKASTGGCTFNLSDCTFDYTLGTVENGHIIAQFEVPQSDSFRFINGGITFDRSTQNSLLSLLPSGHIESEEEQTTYSYYGNTINAVIYQLTNN